MKCFPRLLAGFSSPFFHSFLLALKTVRLQDMWEEKLSLYLCRHCLSASLHAAVTCGLPVRRSSAGSFCSSVFVSEAVPCCRLPEANPIYSRERNNTVCLSVTRSCLRRYLILQEQHLLEELSQPPAPAGGRCYNHRATPPHVYQIPFPGPQAEPPRIIQQTMPPQPATIIQQLPQPPPLITQIPPAQPFAAPRSGSIKEDMVEMMLMQNAQMHQLIMQNMMLKALPPMAFTQPAGASSPLLQHAQQDLQFAAPLAVKAERSRPSAVHHHHHYPPTGVLPVPHGGFPSTSMAHHWTGSMLPALPT
ncbi:uncharacterized protein C21orf58 homolog isoform 2-T2 [Morphnus guianensis]